MCFDDYNYNKVNEAVFDIKYNKKFIKNET